MEKTIIKKEAIIAEYLAGEISYRKLSAKYGITHHLQCKCKPVSELN